MPLIILIAVLCLLKYLEVEFLESFSWWWIIGLAVFTFLYFEFFERMLGLDKRRENIHFEKMKKDRIKRTFEKKK